MRRWVWLAAALALGCGSGSGTDRGGVVIEPPPPPPPPPPNDDDNDLDWGPCEGLVTIRLKGVGAPAGWLRADVASVAFTHGGHALASTLVETGPVTFPAAGAARVAVVPALGLDGAVTTAIALDAPSWCTASGCVPLEGCTAPLAFTFHPAKVSPDRCHVVVHLDVGASVVPASAAFLPRYTVHY